MILVCVLLLLWGRERGQTTEGKAMDHYEENERKKGLDIYDVEPVRGLVRAALDDLMGNNDGLELALWRLIDAAGLLSTHYPGAIGVIVPTGRGFQLTARIPPSPTCNAPHPRRTVR